jgi:hypothetical protein
MAPEQVNQEPEVTEKPRHSALNTVTPLSKYLAMALFVTLPFVGGYIGYTFVPEKVVEVEKIVEVEKRVSVPVQSQNAIYSFDFVSNPSTSTQRLLFSRQELFDREDELYKAFGINKYKTNLPPGVTDDEPTGDLYKLQNESVDSTYTFYQGNGISLLLPYNEGYGYPYYRLTPYDELRDRIFFGGIEPCPAGCLNSGGMYEGSITFYPAGSLEEQISLLESQELTDCEERRVNTNIVGQYCTQRSAMPDRVLFVEGSRYLYGIRDYTSSANSIMYKSMIVE